MPPLPADSSPARAATDPGSAAPEGSWPERLQRGLDRLLVLDVFLVLAGGLWFGLGVVLHLRGTDQVLAVFQRLWFPLFQPALGVLMLAALISGGLGWWRRRGQR
ncbi:MAG: hypothetical protein VKP70_07575 [Cyanobacteriota bacterium]|jgi:hypothetical protein|nr:hypothetical protein [Cyanobacteriota bacterium]